MPQSNGSTLRQHVPSPTLLSSATATPTDSDPSADELLHRVRNPRSALPVRRPGASLLSVSICGVCRDAYTTDAHECASLQVETETAWLLRDRQPLDEYRQWAQGVAA